MILIYKLISGKYLKDNNKLKKNTHMDKICLFSSYNIFINVKEVNKRNK